MIFAEPGDNAGHGILSEIIQCETQYLVCDILIAASCGGGHRDAAARNLEPSPAQPREKINMRRVSGTAGCMQHPPLPARVDKF